MPCPDNLAHFVAQSLDNAEKSGAKQTWIDLVDHGAGDGGGLAADSYGGIMPMQSIADATAKGEAIDAKEHCEEANRKVDGAVANQYLMSTPGGRRRINNIRLHLILRRFARMVIHSGGQAI